MQMPYQTRLQPHPEQALRQSTLPLIDQINTGQCWDECMQRLTHDIPSSVQTDAADLATAIAMCNTAPSCDSYDAIRALHSLTCTHSLDGHIPYQEVHWQSPNDVPSRIILSGALRHQPMRGSWQAHGSDFLDSSQVASMLKHHIASSCHSTPVLFPWSLDNLRLALATKPVAEQCHTGHGDACMALTMVYTTKSSLAVPVIGDNHWRGIFFHGSSQTIYVWDPFGSGFPVDLIQSLGAQFANWHISQISASLQVDGCNCAFWTVWATQQLCYWDTSAVVYNDFGTFMQSTASINGLHARDAGRGLRQTWHAALFAAVTTRPSQHTIYPSQPSHAHCQSNEATPQAQHGEPDWQLPKVTQPKSQRQHEQHVSLVSANCFAVLSNMNSTPNDSAAPLTHSAEPDPPKAGLRCDGCSGLFSKLSSVRESTWKKQIISANRHMAIKGSKVCSKCARLLHKGVMPALLNPRPSQSLAHEKADELMTEGAHESDQPLASDTNLA